MNLHTLLGSPELLLSGCRPPAEGVIASYSDPLQADVGSAKEQRGHPPGFTGLKLYFTRPTRGSLDSVLLIGIFARLKYRVFSFYGLPRHIIQ